MRSAVGVSPERTSVYRSYTAPSYPVYVCIYFSYMPFMMANPIIPKYTAHAAQ